MRKFAPLLALAAALTFPGCGAEVARLRSANSNFRVTYSPPQGPARVWTSNGPVWTESGSDGWKFQDKATGKLVRLSGSVTVEEL